MDLTEAIKARRSIRRYKNLDINADVIRELLNIAIWAPTASNVQPWGFVVIQDKSYMKDLSDRAKLDNLERMKHSPHLEQYRKNMENPNFNIFYGAPALILIYGKKDHSYTYHDCSMAAQNLMLAAREKGLGTCWIGFAQGICDAQDFKIEHSIPLDYQIVAPIILGYPEVFPKKPIPRREYPIFQWLN